MVVATRELSETLPGGSVVLHAAGDALERFESWDYAVQQALRRLGYVLDLPDEMSGPLEQPPQAARAGLSCALCPERTFVNHQGLKLHQTRIHGGAPP